ncbi:hypothetical protein AXG93_1175s1650 [Marchantia polymorpha subsp. ruderalis]|uniref:SET domain-containing protein n=1 Tax=Marchantia polymorpha subsp. ruderalis TaxID=1480154 RepID=A0A176VMJ3_MARPO|nr:hypothetical protein AXG93_1175s1650 [Marchantia polymorpha subsp. ruderalis]
MSGNENCEDLSRWAASKGISDAPRESATTSDGLGHSLVVANFPDAGGRGLAASRNLKEGELILRVPKSALMSVLSAKADPLLSTALARHPCLSSAQILAVHLLNEAAKGKSSTWSPYLIHLPRIYHTLPYFVANDVQALQVEEARWVAEKAIEKAVMDWEGAKGFMHEISLRRRFMSFKAWLWASATVSTRTLHVPWDEAGTLCPVGDLFNYAAPGEYVFNRKETVTNSAAEDNKDLTSGHSLLFKAEELDDRDSCSNGLEVETAEEMAESDFDNDISCNGVTIRERLRDGGFEADHGEYCFYARQDYHKGQQVLLCYGLYNNLELLEHYGFLLPHNPNDNVHIRLPDSEEFGVVNGNPGMSLGGTTCLEIDGSPSFSLVAGLRLRATHPFLRKSKGHFALMGKQISVDSDILIYQWLEKKCTSLLACQPTSLDDDLILKTVASSAQSFAAVEDLALSLCETPSKAHGDRVPKNVVHEIQNLAGFVCMEQRLLKSVRDHVRVAEKSLSYPRI